MSFMGRCLRSREREERMERVLARGRATALGPELPRVPLKTEAQLDATLPEGTKRVGAWSERPITPEDRGLEQPGERVVRVSRCWIQTRSGASQMAWHIEFGPSAPEGA